MNTMVGYFMFAALETMLPLTQPTNLYEMFIRKPDKWIPTLIYCGIPLATANYVFNAGIFISTNTGVSTILIQINIIYVYLISSIRYDESINYVCLLGAVLLIGSIYATLFTK